MLSGEVALGSVCACILRSRLVSQKHWKRVFHMNIAKLCGQFFVKPGKYCFNLMDTKSQSQTNSTILQHLLSIRSVCTPVSGSTYSLGESHLCIAAPWLFELRFPVEKFSWNLKCITKCEGRDGITITSVTSNQLPRTRPALNKKTTQ